LGTEHTGRIIRGFATLWSIAAAAMAGNATEARRDFTALQWWDQDPDACEWEPEKAIAQAWVFAAEGTVSQAITITRDAATQELERGRHA
jgi:hypothetical protein